MGTTLTERLVSKFANLFQTGRPFRLVLTHYHREPTYSLALASLSGYAKREIPNLEVSLVDALGGDDPDQYARRVAERRPDLVAISSTHPNWLPFQPYLRAVRSRLPRTPTLVGGYQAIFSPEETLANPAVDWICLGDGERPLADLIRRLRGVEPSEEPIPGLWEKLPAGQIRKSAGMLTEDLGEIPFPDYSLFEREGDVRWIRPNAIESQRLTSLPVMTGRGCPYRCTYCSNVSMLERFGGNKNYLRRHPPEMVIERLLDLRSRYNAEFFQFVDETFLWDIDYARRFLALYREQVGLPFSMFSRIEQMSDEYCRFAAESGCHSMWYGVECGSEEYRARYLGRRMSNQRLIDAADCAHRHGIKIMCFAMVGLPFESRAQIQQTIDLMGQIRPELSIFTQFVPLPGTPLYELAKKADLLLESEDGQQMWKLGHLNLRESPGAATRKDMLEVAEQIARFNEIHNRPDE